MAHNFAPFICFYVTSSRDTNKIAFHVLLLIKSIIITIITITIITIIIIKHYY